MGPGGLCLRVHRQRLWKAALYYLRKVMEILGNLQQLQKVKCYIHIQKSPKGSCWEVQTSQLYLDENGPSPLGAHFWAHEEPEFDDKVGVGCWGCITHNTMIKWQNLETKWVDIIYLYYLGMSCCMCMDKKNRQT